MRNEILIAVLLAILFHPSNEVPVRLQRNPEMPLINDPANQRNVYKLLEDIASLASTAIIKDGVDHGLQLRSVADNSSNQTPRSLNSTVNAATNNNASAHSEEDNNVEERKLYDLLNRIIALILQAINHASLSKNNFPMDKFLTNKTETATVSGVETTSTTPIHSSASSLVTGSSGDQNSTPQATTTHSAKKLREANFYHLYRKNAIGENKDIKKEMTAVDELVESDDKNILARSYSDNLDKTLKEKNELHNDTNSYFIGGDSNLVDSVNNEKEGKDVNTQRLSDNLKEISNIVSDISPVPKKTRNAIFEESPKLNDSLNESLADPDRLYLSEKGDGESKLVNQPELYETKHDHLRNDEKHFVEYEQKNQSTDTNLEERNLSFLKRVEKNIRKKKSSKKIMNGDGKNGKINNSNLCESNDPSDNDDMQKFICSFTFEINNGKSENSSPEKKKSKRLINGFRKTRLRKKSKDERRVPIKEDKKIQNEYLSEEMDDVQKRRLSSLSNQRFIKNTDEHADKEESSNYEDGNQESLETNKDNMSHREHFRSGNKMKKHINKINKDRRQNSVKIHRLNMAAIRNEQELHKSPDLKENKLNEKRKRNHTLEKSLVESGLEFADSNKNELNNVRLYKTAEMEEENDENNKRTMEFHKNVKNEELGEPIHKQQEFNNDEAEYEEGEDEMEEEEEEGEEDKGHHDELHHDEYAKKTSSLKKSKEELEPLNAEYYE